MRWIVTYRFKDGNIKEETFEAETRTDLFAELKHRDISPIRVSEETRRTPTVRCRSVFIKPFFTTVGGILIVALILALLHCISSLRSKATDKLAKDTHESPIKVDRTTPSKEHHSVNKINTNLADPINSTENDVAIISSTVTTNSYGAVIEKLVLQNGKKVTKVHPPKPIFNNVSDQVIAWAVSAKPGHSMPPLPNLDKSLEQDFIDSLVSPIIINENDSDEIKELKALVKETKAYIAHEIKNGGTLLEILDQHQKEIEKIADSHLMAVQEMQKIRAEMGDAAAKEFINEVNESFKIRGIPEIEFRPHGNESKKDK